MRPTRCESPTERYSVSPRACGAAISDAFSASLKKAKAGTVWINTYGYTDVRLPWGGAGDSGFGREHGTEALANFTEPKAVWMNLNV